MFIVIVDVITYRQHYSYLIVSGERIAVSYIGMYIHMVL